ncbi:MAG: phosphatidate cytidylyltransferase [Ilumatobacter sp.]|jgi:phosphatidate cytidylyltransferase
MTDDIWRPDEEGSADRRRPGRLEAEMDAFDDTEFGGPLFGKTSENPVVAVEPSAQRPNEPAPVAAPVEVVANPDDWPELASGGSGRLRMDDPSGSMPHWTEDATGEVPVIERPKRPADPTDDLDVWSTFTTDTPVWKEGDAVDKPSGRVSAASPADPTGEISWEDAPIVEPADARADLQVHEAHNVAAGAAPSEALHREPARITIGTDPSGMPRRPQPQRRGGSPQRPPAAGNGTPGGGKRNLPVAVATGLLLSAAFLGAAMWSPAAALTFVAVALGLAAVEYFSKVTEKGYRPAVAAGVAACVACPLAAYWVGEKGIPLVLAFAFFAGSLGFIGSDSIEVGPMPNMAITMLGVVWIGLMGSFAALIIRYSNFFGDLTIGTDTLVLLAVGVVANDVGAYFVGSAFGRTPLRSWISPNKSVEGFLGGTILTLIVMLLVGMRGLSDTWSDTSHLLMLGIVIAIFAPLGDLTESMFKRNLDVKDFGSLIKGHGGVLDRFDGFLFALPAVYYLMLVIEPWTKFSV